MLFLSTLSQSERQADSSEIRAHVADSISYDDKCCAKHASFAHETPQFSKLILKAYQPVWGYFVLRDQGIEFIVYSYLNFYIVHI